MRKGLSVVVFTNYRHLELGTRVSKEDQAFLLSLELDPPSHFCFS